MIYTTAGVVYTRPFVTEELWQRLPGRENPVVAAALGESIMVAANGFPEGEPTWLNEDAAEEVALLREIVRAVGELRSEYNVNKSGKFLSFLPSFYSYPLHLLLGRRRAENQNEVVLFFEQTCD